MQFNSLIFFFFLLVFFMRWTLARRWNQSRWVYLTAASFVFYGWWDWRFLFLIVGSGLLDFLAGWGMIRFEKYRRHLLIASIAGNVGTLAVFKYLEFFIENIWQLMGLVGMEGAIRPLGLILPVGISFYTFQSMSYTIDVYRGELKPTQNVFHFFAFLSMFPQLVAGPIVRARDLLPQLEKSVSVNEEDRWEGFVLVIHGLFKKVVIADNLAPIVNHAFEMQTPLASSGYWWIIMAMFSFQIYCDFSGYSDIARGLLRWMGYRIGINFNHPYIASSFSDFWGRWHISLSTWFRDYVYIPLGGNRKSSITLYRNLRITLLISGLWHGAAWTFVGWSFLHCVYLSVEHLTGWPERLQRLPGGRHVATLLVLMLLMISWVLFRAQSFEQASVVLMTMFAFENISYHHIGNLIGYQGLFFLLIMILREMSFYIEKSPVMIQRRWSGRSVELATMSLMTFMCLAMHGPGSASV